MWPKRRKGCPPMGLSESETVPSDGMSIAFTVSTSIENPSAYQISLFPYCEETDDAFVSASIDIMAHLLSSLEVLTSVHLFSAPSAARRKKTAASTQTSFFDSYSEFLLAHDLAQNTYLDDSSDLLTQTTGINLPLTQLLIFGKHGIFSYETVGFHRLPSITSFEEGKAATHAPSAAIRLEFERYPDTLYIFGRESEIPVSMCVQKLQDICNTKGIQLKLSSNDISL